MNRLPENWRHRKIRRITVRPTYLEELNGDFGDLLVATRGLAWEWEIPGGHSSRGIPHLYRFYLQEPQEILEWRAKKNPPLFLARRGEGTILKDSWGAFTITKAYSARERLFAPKQRHSSPSSLPSSSTMIEVRGQRPGCTCRKAEHQRRNK